MVSIAIDSSVIFQIINFLLMILVLNYFLYRPIRSILKQRQEKIAGDEGQIAGMAEQAESQESEIETRLAEARRDGFGEKENLKGAGQSEEKRIVDAANQEANEALARIKAQVAEEVTTAREALRGDLTVFSRELAQKILGRSLS